MFPFCFFTRAFRIRYPDVILKSVRPYSVLLICFFCCFLILGRKEKQKV